MVVTGAKPYAFPDHHESPESRARNRLWVEQVQARLDRLSRRGRQVLVTDSGHAIPFEDPGAIVTAIREVIREGPGEPHRLFSTLPQ